MATILHTEANAPHGLQEQGFAGRSRPKKPGTASIIVNASLASLLPRITARHRNGISPRERDLWCEGIDHMATKGPLAFVSVTAAAEPIVRDLARKLKSDIALRQRRAGM